MAKAANLCPETFADELVSTVTDSGVNHYVLKTCRTFNARKCVMDSVGDVVNTIQGFFVPQQQKPVIPQLIQRVPQVLRSEVNAYSVEDNNKNHNYRYNNDNDDYNSAGTALFNPIRELINRRAKIPATSTTEEPVFVQSVRDLFDRQYIPEASDVKPVKDEPEAKPFDHTLRSLFMSLIGNSRPNDKKNDSTVKNDDDVKEDKAKGQPSLLGTISTFLDSGLSGLSLENHNQNRTTGSDFFGDIFKFNGTEGLNIVKGIADQIN